MFIFLRLSKNMHGFLYLLKVGLQKQEYLLAINGNFC